MPSHPNPMRVVIAGGGVAAAECALALRAYAEERVEIELVAPDEQLPFRPASTAAPFVAAPAQRFDLAALAESVGAQLVRDRIEAVAGNAKRVRLASGAQRTYDVLVLALGARARAAVPGAITFRDQRDAAMLQAVVDELRRGAWRGFAVAVAPGVSWTLPAYEIALLAAGEAERLGLRTEISLSTPEPAPLAGFGSNVSATIAMLLAERGVHVRCAVTPECVDRRGLRLHEQARPRDRVRVKADRVIALPTLVGQRISGLPADTDGFIRTGARGGVVGMPDVYAAGDMTTFAVKQGGVAAQQADAIATLIATRAGAKAPVPPSALFLRAQLFGAPAPLFLEARLDRGGRPIEGSCHTEPPWWPAGTLFAPHLAPWMAQQALAEPVAAAAG